jgi:hypothetical protein
VAAQYSWSGHWIKLGAHDPAYSYTGMPLNLSNYRYLKFFARAQNNTTNPEKIKIEIVSGPGAPHQANAYITGITAAWPANPITIDLLSISGASGYVEMGSLRQINIVYTNDDAVDKSGVVFYDSFSLSP